MTLTVTQERTSNNPSDNPSKGLLPSVDLPAPGLEGLARVSAILAAVGLVGVIVGFILDVDRAWANWLLCSFYFTSLALGGLFVIASSNLANGAWHITSKRIAESFSAWFGVGLVAMLLLLAGAGGLYEWTHHHDTQTTHGALLEHKSPWLNLPFFAIRIVLYFGIWMLAARTLTHHSERLGVTGDLRHLKGQQRSSAIFIVLLAPTITLAAFDWLMSLDATWFSTMFGVYQFSGAWQASLAAIIVAASLLRRSGWLRIPLTESHWHSLGQWLFATSVFWAYIWFFQWMLIWYANIPEETQYFLRRSEGGWWHISYIVNPVVNFLLPFLLLLPRRAKRYEALLFRVALLILVGRWIDLWVGIMPLQLEQPSPGLAEIATMVLFTGIFGWVVLRRLGRVGNAIQADPFLEEGLNQHT